MVVYPLWARLTYIGTSALWAGGAPNDANTDSIKQAW